jgi:F-type H+-transporting ATPase subunit delta
MSVIRIATRYAKSLIDLAKEQGDLENVVEDIKYFNEATDNRDFYLMLKSPIVNATKKQQVIDALFKDKFSELTLSFLSIVLNKGREMHLPEIAAEFMEQYRSYKHISKVKLITATSLSAETISKIKQRLVGSDITDDHVELEVEIDPKILGGFVLDFDDRLYDASIAHQLEKLKKDFTNNDFINAL